MYSEVLLNNFDRSAVSVDTYIYYMHKTKFELTVSATTWSSEGTYPCNPSLPP